MARLLLPLAFLIALGLGSAWAHIIELHLSVTLENNTLKTYVTNSEGYVVNGVKLDYLLMNERDAVGRGELLEVADGEYHAPAPAAPQGEYTLLVRDTTFPSEAVEREARVSWPLAKPVDLVFPPGGDGGGTSPSLVLALLALPVLAGLAVLALVLFKRPRQPGPEVSA